MVEGVVEEFSKVIGSKYRYCWYVKTMIESTIADVPGSVRKDTQIID